jgi:hypothetical protein
VGLAYRIEAYDLDRVGLPELVRSWPEFQAATEGELRFGDTQGNVLVSLRIEDNIAHVCQHVATRETDALLGLLMRSILAWNDHVVVSEC